MWSYLVRRVLLMIPTLFGVTIVSFVIMQLAPGDPLLMQADAGGAGGRSAQTREAFLLQKRDLKLDKPLVLNFNDFRDFTAPIDAAAHFLGLAPAEVAAELAELAEKPDDPVAKARLAFLRSLPIADFDERLTEPEQREGLAAAVLAYTRVYCEDTGSHGVPAAIGVLKSDADLHDRIGAIRALEYMVPEPFRYTFSRTPLASEAPLIESTWRSWWQKAEAKFSPIDADRRKVLAARLQKLATETDRQDTVQPVGTVRSGRHAVFHRRAVGRIAAGSKGDRGDVPAALQQQAAGDRRAAGRLGRAGGRSGSELAGPLRRPARAVSADDGGESCGMLSATRNMPTWSGGW